MRNNRNTKAKGIKQIDESVKQLNISIYLHDLRNIDIRAQFHGPDMHLVGIVKEISGDGLDLTRPRGGPHEGLSVRANLRYDLFELRFETHVKPVECTGVI